MNGPTAIAASLLLAGCTSDVVTSTYPTLADARADELFGRGWLPDILPPSATDIRTTNNLDLNVSDGEFSFTPSDAPVLFRQLHKGTPNMARYANETAAYARLDYSVWSFQDEQSTWIFFCQGEKGYCKYTMWLDRQLPNNSFKPNPLRVSA